MSWCPRPPTPPTAVVDPSPITATRTVSLGPGDRDEPSAPRTILGIPSANPAVIERFRNFLRVIVFIAVLAISWLCADATTARKIEHSEKLGPPSRAMLRCDDAVKACVNGQPFQFEPPHVGCYGCHSGSLAFTRDPPFPVLL